MCGRLRPSHSAMFSGSGPRPASRGGPALEPGEEHLQRKDGLANEYVFAVGIDRDGYKWFGTKPANSRYRDGQWKTFFRCTVWRITGSIHSRVRRTAPSGSHLAGVNRYDPKRSKSRPT